MLAAFTDLKHAEKVKNFLVEKKLINRDYRAMKQLDHIYYPIIKKIKVPHAKVVNTKFKFEKKGRKHTIESLLKSKLTLTELSRIPKSQEVVGDIMILEVPESLYKKEKLIAEAYLELNKNIVTVVKKTKMHSGVFRTRKVKILAGKRTKETIHQENGIRIKLHLEKTYFSARSANERLRIAKQVKKGEEVLVMFSGAAPFPLVIAKNSQAKIIYGIELNLDAGRFATESVVLNKLTSKIKLFNGNVIAVMPRIKKKFDRIAMPLPKTGEEFLYLALKNIKPKGIVHLYAFLHENDILAEAKRIKKVCEQLKYPVRILRKVKCGQFSPGTYRVCFDIKVK